MHDCVHTCLVSLQQNKRTLLWLLNCSQGKRVLKRTQRKRPLKYQYLVTPAPPPLNHFNHLPSRVPNQRLPIIIKGPRRSSLWNSRPVSGRPQMSVESKSNGYKCCLESPPAQKPLYLVLLQYPLFSLSARPGLSVTTWPTYIHPMCAFLHHSTGTI